MNLFVQLDAWLSALLFAALMFVGWFLGSRVHAWRVARDGRTAKSSRIEDGGLALFGLLLAFCFSGAVGHYESRQSLLLNDTLAISELATVAAVLDEPDRSALHQELVVYVKQRLVFGTMRLDDARLPQVIREGQQSQARMLAIVAHVIASKNTPTLHVALMNAYNGLTEAHDRRLYGVRRQVNASILLMLVLFGIFAAFTMGRLHDPESDGRFGVLRVGAYIFLVSLVYFVTVDMEQPRRGLILVSQAPMQALLDSLTEGSPKSAP